MVFFEQEAASQAVRRDVKRDDEVPTFYNAAVERDLHDPRGYDVLFIDGMVKGSVLTRASHSCQPNAEMRVRVREGKYSVEMVTTREVRTGEEICWDYRCQTDSEKEMRRAICLCGSKNCRVSYLHYNGESELAAFADERCAVLHDAARLLASCVDADALRLPETLTINPKGRRGRVRRGNAVTTAGKEPTITGRARSSPRGCGRMTRECSRAYPSGRESSRPSAWRRRTRRRSS